MDDQVFMSNLKGSALANLMTGTLLIVFWLIKNRCQHSECVIENSCFRCKVNNDDDEEGQDVERGERRGVRRQETVKQTKIRVRALQPRQHTNLSQKHPQGVATD